ncbi:MAG: hypothetical protein AAGH88_04720 [Planctomycetota bacterium]
MNDSTNNQSDDATTPLAPLNEHEQAWAGLLKHTDADLLSDSDAFVDGVMDRLERERGVFVLARVGRRLGDWKPLAAAAAVAMAALLGWFVWTGDPDHTGPNLAEQTPPTTTKLPGTLKDNQHADARPRPEDINVGQLIGDFSRSVTRPQVTVLPPEQTPNRLQKVLSLFENPVQDAGRFIPQRANPERG